MCGSTKGFCGSTSIRALFLSEAWYRNNSKIYLLERVASVALFFYEGVAMLDKGKVYLIRPTVRQLWKIYRGCGSEWKELEYEIREAELVSLLKTRYVFRFVGDFTEEKWSVPFHAVEIFSIVNKPLNAASIKVMAKLAMTKFQKGGFDSLSDDELRYIIAFLETRLLNRSNKFYPMEVAENLIFHLRRRSNIIRTLRNLYMFRNTSRNRCICINIYF